MAAAKTKNSIDMLNGPLLKKILMFTLPIAAGSIMQQLFNSADVAVVGKFAGSQALAAVGTNGSIINLIVNLFGGVAVGANVIIARSIGEGRMDRAKKAVHTAITLGIIMGIALMIIAFILAPQILKLISCPEDVIKPATNYLRIFCLAIPFLTLYNFSAAILRSRGDTKRPLLILLVAGAINVGLNLFFVVKFHMGVEGVAIATAVSNVFSCVVALTLLTREKGILKFSFRNLGIDKFLASKILGIGIPSGLQGVVFCIANIMVQSGMNSLGSTTVAACTTALNFEYYTWFIPAAFGQAAVTFIGQNYGAGKLDRCYKTIRICMFSAILICAGLSTLFVIPAKTFAGLFTSDAVVLALAVKRMRIITTFEALNAFSEILGGAMRVFKRAVLPTIICILGICGVRITWIFTVFRSAHTMESLCWAYLVSWVITETVIVIAYKKVKKKVEREFTHHA